MAPGGARCHVPGGCLWVPFDHDPTVRTTPRVLECGPVLLNPETREVTVKGDQVELTAREFDLLAYLMRKPGRVHTRDEIFEDVWGYDFLGESKVIDVFVSSLRRKLASTPEQSIVRTVRGVGYTVRA